jgi:hypothetical protein
MIINYIKAPIQKALKFYLRKHGKHIMYEQIKFELSKKTFYTKNNIQKPMFLENKYY